MMHMNGRENEPEEELISWLRGSPPKAISSLIGNVVSLGTRVGKAKASNQDRVLFARFGDAAGQPVDLVILCDGMGGMQSGERCAELGIAGFVFGLAAALGLGRHPEEALRDATLYANNRVYEQFRSDGGTTLTALLIHRHTAWACAVGDTRLYGHGKNGLRQLSRDDTVEGALAEVRASPDAAIRPSDEPEHLKLLQYVGMGLALEPHVFRIEQPREYRYLFICSDGSYRPPGNLLAPLAAEASTPRQLVERLCAVAEYVGGSDDATVAVVDARMIDEAMSEELPLRRVLRFWGPAVTQNASLLNFGREVWPRYIVERRNMAVHGRLPDRRTDSDELAADNLARLIGHEVLHGVVAVGVPQDPRALPRTEHRPPPKKEKSGKGKKNAKTGSESGRASKPEGNQLIMQVGPARENLEREDAEEDGDDQQHAPVDARSTKIDKAQRHTDGTQPRHGPR